MDICVVQVCVVYIYTLNNVYTLNACPRPRTPHTHCIEDVVCILKPTLSAKVDESFNLHVNYTIIALKKESL